MKSLPRVSEPDEGIVHYRGEPTSDFVTLCGMTDFLGHRKAGKPTSAKVSCQPCMAIVRYIHAHKPPDGLPDREDA